jgi:predicted site-specific integrase-resolvase
VVQVINDELWTPGRLAEYLEVSEQTLANWRSAGKGPSYIKAEGAVRYWVSAVQAYLKERTVMTMEP